MGYDETVTVAYDVYIFQDILNSMRGLGVSECYNIGQALDYAKSRRGEYDPYYYEDEGVYTHPVLAGNSNWYFPPLYTVSFFVDGMNNPYETYTVTQNSSLNVNDFPTPPAIGGMEFSHWKTRGGTAISGSVTVKLMGLDPSRNYRITNKDNGESIVKSGAELASGFDLRSDQPRSSLLLKYQAE